MGKFFFFEGWSKGCHFLHLLREVQARCFISWQLYLLTQFSQYCTLKTAYDSKTSPCSSHYEQVKGAWSSSIATTARENNGTLVRLGLKPRDDAPTSMGRGWNACVPLTRGLGIDSIYSSVRKEVYEMNCTQKQQLVCFPKVWIHGRVSPWERIYCQSLQPCWNGS